MNRFLLAVLDAQGRHLLPFKLFDYADVVFGLAILVAFIACGCMAVVNYFRKK